MNEKYKIVINLYGTIGFFNKNYVYHRDDGPAIYGVSRYNRRKYCKWIKNGSHHRITGPAIEYVDGDICWCINGNYFENKAEFYNNLTDEEKIMALSSPDFINSTDVTFE